MVSQNNMQTKHWLITIIAGAFLLRILGVTYGLPLTIVADEPAHIYGSLIMLMEKTLIPGLHPAAFLDKLYFPPFLSYLLLIPICLVVGITVLFSGSLATAKLFLAIDPSWLFLASRLLSVILGTLTVYLIYRVGKNIFKEEKPALISAAILGLSLLHINFSHWGRHWSSVTFLFTAVLAILSSTKLSSEARYFYASLLSAIAFGINYQGGTIAIVVLLWFIFVDKLFNLESFKQAFVYKSVFLFIAIAGMAIALYPQNLTVVTHSDIARFYPEGRSLLGFISGYLFYIKALLLSEPILLLLSLSGAVVAMRKKERTLLTLCLFALLYIATFYLAFFILGRYILMLYPVLALLSGYALSKLNIGYAYIACLLMFIIAVRFDYLLIKNDTRVQAINYAEENVPANSRVAVLARLTRLPSTKEAIDAQEKLDPNSLRQVDRAEREIGERKEKTFQALNLGTVSGGAISDLRQYLIDNHYEYLIVSPEAAKNYNLDLSTLPPPTASFLGYDANDDASDMTNGFGGGLPFLFSGRSNGPTIQITKL